MAGDKVEKKTRRVNKRKSRTAVASPSPSSSSSEESAEEDVTSLAVTAKREHKTKSPKSITDGATTKSTRDVKPEKTSKKEKGKKRRRDADSGTVESPPDEQKAKTDAEANAKERKHKRGEEPGHDDLKDDEMTDVNTDHDPQHPSSSKPSNRNSHPQDDNATAEASFQDFYLRQITREFANDLDKLRTAPDFHGGKSVEALVVALKQGASMFSLEEKRKIGAVGV